MHLWSKGSKKGCRDLVLLWILVVSLFPKRLHYFELSRHPKYGSGVELLGGLVKEKWTKFSKHLQKIVCSSLIFDSTELVSVTRPEM